MLAVQSSPWGRSAPGRRGRRGNRGRRDAERLLERLDALGQLENGTSPVIGAAIVPTSWAWSTSRAGRRAIDWTPAALSAVESSRPPLNSTVCQSAQLVEDIALRADHERQVPGVRAHTCDYPNCLRRLGFTPLPPVGVGNASRLDRSRATLPF